MTALLAGAGIATIGAGTGWMALFSFLAGCTGIAAAFVIADALNN